MCWGENAAFIDIPEVVSRCANCCSSILMDGSYINLPEHRSTEYKTAMISRYATSKGLMNSVSQ